MSAIALASGAQIKPLKTRVQYDKPQVQGDSRRPDTHQLLNYGTMLAKDQQNNKYSGLT